MRQLRALWRLCLVGAQLLRGAWIIWRTFPRLGEAERGELVQAWTRQMLGRLGITLVLEGQPPKDGPVLLVANHISWLDIGVMHAARHCRFISKSDIKHWPLVGMLATGAGTLYIERTSKRDALRVAHHMAERLQAGDILALFPEGTTGDGSTVLPFHANLLQAAIASNSPIQPVALQFTDALTGQTSFAPCYIGDESLMTSLWRTLCSSNIQAVVRFGTPQYANGRERREWARDLRQAIVDMRAKGL